MNNSKNPAISFKELSIRIDWLHLFQAIFLQPEISMHLTYFDESNTHLNMPK